MILIESREIDPPSSLQEPKAAWAGVWHLWTVILPRRSITGRLVFGKVWSGTTAGVGSTRNSSSVQRLPALGLLVAVGIIAWLVIS